MAKKSVAARNTRREALVAKYRVKRQALTSMIKDKKQSDEARETAMRKRELMPRNSSRIRLRNRCGITKRPRGVYRKFGLSRHMIRGLAMMGLIPGLRKSSW